MHPSRHFAWEDEAAMLAFIGRVSFATICVDGPAVVHAPVVVDGRRLRFHVSRANRAVPHLADARAIVSVMGPDAYISPDWYGTPDQVPTWNYVAVEAEGVLRPLPTDAMPALLDDLSAANEAALSPKPAWTRDKMNPDLFQGLLKAIVGFEMEIGQLRGTMKLGQHKSEAEQAGVAAALGALGRTDMMALSEGARP